MKPLLMAAALALVLVPLAGAQVYTVSRDDNILRTINPLNAQTTGTQAMLHTGGGTITGANGLAYDPVTQAFWVLLKLTGQQGRELAIVDTTNGLCFSIGDTGDQFAGIAFTWDGTLYGVTGDGATVAEALFLLDKSTAAATLVRFLGAGSDGEALAGNVDDGLLYHASGLGTQNVTEIFETINPGAQHATANVALSGADYDEALALGYEGSGTFLLSDLNDDLYRVTTTGLVAQIGTLNHSVKGIATVVTPSFVPKLHITTPNPGTLNIDLGSLNAGHGYIVLFSLMVQTPTGSGLLFGIGPDAWTQIFNPIVFGVLSPQGAASHTFNGIPAGLSVDAVGLTVSPAFLLSEITNVVHFVTI